MADEQDDLESGREVTLFRGEFAKKMLLQKAEEAGFFTALEAQKWNKLLELLGTRSIGFFHAGTEAAKVVAAAHGRGKDMTLRIRAEGNGNGHPSA